MASRTETNTVSASDQRDQAKIPTPLPTAGRRGALHLLALGMALLGALGLRDATAAPADQHSQAESALAATPKPPRGKRGRRGRKGNRGLKGPGGEPGGGGPEGPEGPAGPSSGAFLGLVRDSDSKEVEPGVLGVITLECPAAAPGERVVAVGGGFGGQVLDGKGFFITSNEPTSDTEWLVGGVNSSTGDISLFGYIVCARFTA